MRFYVRQFKDDFIDCNITITTTPEGSFELSWFRGQALMRPADGEPNVVYPDIADIVASFNVTNILTEKKTNLKLDNPHQLIACGISFDTNTFSCVDVLKYTFHNKGSTGFFKNTSKVDPVFYVLVPFADSPMSDWKFIAVAKLLKVNGVDITETFDIDVNKTIADVCNENLPGITLSKEGNTILAQLTNPDGSLALKADIDIYFETTAGYLTKARSKTNDQGIATTELIGATEGKVKAGFKYFSGKAELAV
jgi:hypothetical protein